MSVSKRYGLHEVNSLSVDLDEGEDVSRLHGFTQRVEARRRVQTLLFGKTLLRVFGYDEVFSRLPDHHKAKIPPPQKNDFYFNTKIIFKFPVQIIPGTISAVFK